MERVSDVSGAVCEADDEGLGGRGYRGRAVPCRPCRPGLVWTGRERW